VVSCHVFQHLLTCVVSFADKIALSVELTGLDVDSESIGLPQTLLSSACDQTLRSITARANTEQNKSRTATDSQY